MNDLTHVDLFSGIGGFAIAAGWAGFRTVAFCEIEPFCQEVLKKHWPDVPVHDDIRTFKWAGESPTLLTGGFPCQDISVANTRGTGLSGERSGLWKEMLRIIGEARPRYALMENSANLLMRGVDGVLWDLAEVGYDAEWHCIPASYVGAPHDRDRIWIVAYPQCLGREPRPIIASRIYDGRTHGQPCDGGEVCDRPADTWPPEPAVGRVAYGVPRRVDRITALGNAIVPAVAYEIIKAIAEIERSK